MNMSKCEDYEILGMGKEEVRGIPVIYQILNFRRMIWEKK
jgi:hypothetical protein